MTIRRSAAKAGLISVPSLLFRSNNRWASPYINHFISADTVVASYANPQTLNRYSYVGNNPLRYTDPTGHTRVEDAGSSKGSLNCSKYSQYCNNGKPKSSDELRNMRNENKNSGGPLMPIVIPGPCSGRFCPLAEVSVTAYPETRTYHPLDGNLVYDVPTYDYSYFPPKLIGHQMMFYGQDDIHFSLKNLVTPSDPLTAADFAQTVGNGLRWLGSKSVGGLAELLAPAALPELGTALSAAAGIDSVNRAITIDGHLETKIYDTYQSPFSTPFDPKKIP